MRSLDKRTRLVRVRRFVAGAPGFCERSEVVDKASELFVDMLGEKGSAHSRQWG